MPSSSPSHSNTTSAATPPAARSDAEPRNQHHADFTETESTEPPRPPLPKADTRLPFVLHNPYQAAAVVTPETARRQQEGGGSLPAVKGRGGHGNTEGRGPDGGGGGDGERGREGGAEGRARDLKQMPSLIAVQDVYPPELSRYDCT